MAITVECSEIKDLQMQVYKIAPEYSYMKSFHLTLHYLGLVPDIAIKEIKSIISKAIFNLGPLHLEVSGINCFHKNNVPFVYYASIKENAKLSELANTISREISTLGETRSIDFIPHISLARVKKYDQSKHQQLMDLEFPPLNLELASISIYESKTGKDTEHKVIETFRLDKGR